MPRSQTQAHVRPLYREGVRHFVPHRAVTTKKVPRQYEKAPRQYEKVSPKYSKGVPKYAKMLPKYAKHSPKYAKTPPKYAKHPAKYERVPPGYSRQSGKYERTPPTLEKGPPMVKRGAPSWCASGFLRRMEALLVHVFPDLVELLTRAEAFKPATYFPTVPAVDCAANKLAVVHAELREDFAAEYNVEVSRGVVRWKYLDTQPAFFGHEGTS